MSGFEVVGVFLGALPLILSALEGYQKLGRKRELFKARNHHIIQLIQALEEQKVLIESDVEIVLRSVGVDEVEFVDDTENAYKRLVERADLVEDFMGRRYNAYITTLLNCEGTLFKIAREIVGLKPGTWKDDGKLNNMLQLNSSLNLNDHEFRKRLKFCMRRDDLDKTISELDHHTKTLRRLRVASATVNQCVLDSTSRRNAKSVKLLQKVRSKAQSLYNAFFLNHSRHCHSIHEARVSVDDQLAMYKGLRESKLLKSTPAISFHVALKCSTGNCGVVYHTDVIEVLDDDPLSVTIGKATNPQAVSWNIPVAASPLQTMEDLKDLCEAILKPPMSPKPMRLYLHEGDKLCVSYDTSKPLTAVPVIVEPDSFVSLKDLWSISKKRMPLRKRIQVAALIALTIVQLCTTPWCGGIWTEQCWFPKEKALDEPHTEHPFLSCSFLNSPSVGKQSSRKAVKDLLEIGIMIVEVFCQQSIEEFCNESQLTLTDDEDSRRNAARQWLDRDEDKFTPDLWEAATICVECRIQRAVVDWGDPYVSQVVFEGVILPLIQNCQGRPRED